MMQPHQHPPQQQQQANPASRGGGGGGRGGPAWIPSAAFRDTCSELFVLAGAATVGSTLTVPQAAEFLRRSGLPSESLSQIWGVAVGAATEVSLDSFMVACRLVAHAQGGKPVSLEALKQISWMPLDDPTFEGLTTKGAGGSSQGGGGTGASGGRTEHSGSGLGTSSASSSVWEISATLRLQYEELFRKDPAVASEMASGLQVNQVKVASTQMKDSLLKNLGDVAALTVRRVFELADVDRDGKLDVDEFCAARHLLVAVAKRGLDLPSSLPRNILPPHRRSGLQQTRSMEDEANRMLAEMDGERQRTHAAEESHRRSEQERKEKDALLKVEQTDRIKAEAAARAQAQELATLHELTALLGEAHAIQQDLTRGNTVLQSAQLAQRSFVERAQTERQRFRDELDALESAIDRIDVDIDDAQEALSDHDASVLGLRMELGDRARAFTPSGFPGKFAREPQSERAVANGVGHGTAETIPVPDASGDELGEPSDSDPSTPRSSNALANLREYNSRVSQHEGRLQQITLVVSSPATSGEELLHIKAELEQLVGVLDKLLSKHVDAVQAIGLTHEDAVRTQRKELVERLKGMSARVLELHKSCASAIAGQG